MRETKFRGKCVDNGEWVYGDLVKKNGRAWIVTEFETPKSIKCAGLQLLSTTFEVHLETVGQYTGLKYKNNKGIFEGDIVASVHVSRGGIRKYRGAVYFDETYSAFGINEGTVGCEWLMDIGVIKVIGNIHDNKELLTDEQEPAGCQDSYSKVKQ